jgi:hypothetical protein
LATGATATEAVTAARDAVAALGSDEGRRILLYGDRGLSFGEIGLQHAAAPDSHQVTDALLAAASTGAEHSAQQTEDRARAREEERITREIERKRATGAYDVFLCHNSSDKPVVRRLAMQLKTRGILPWLDEWELPPGQPWQPLLERQIADIRASAVFAGAAGVGPWQEQEMYSFLREFVARRSPVIPVLLPNAPDTPELPIFLKAMTWVDFRAQDPDPFERLIWGITGKRMGSP